MLQALLDPDDSDPSPDTCPDEGDTPADLVRLVYTMPRWKLGLDFTYHVRGITLEGENKSSGD